MSETDTEMDEALKQELLRKYGGFDRLDVVDYWIKPLSEGVKRRLSSKEMELIHKLTVLSHCLPTIPVSGRDLKANLGDVVNKNILVAGAVRDMCCSIRAYYIRNAGGIAVIPDELTSMT